jgi:hypothetical protein
MVFPSLLAFFIKHIQKQSIKAYRCVFRIDNQVVIKLELGVKEGLWGKSLSGWRFANCFILFSMKNRMLNPSQMRNPLHKLILPSLAYFHVFAVAH